MTTKPTQEQLQAKPVPQAAPTPQEVPEGGSLASLNEPPGSSIGGNTEPAAEPPELLDLEPEVAVIGEPDLTLTCTGEGFTADTKIWFNGGEEATVYVSDTVVTTMVRPSTATTAGEYEVTVKNAAGESEPLTFEFVEPTRAATAKAKPKKPAKVSKKKRR